MTHGVSPSHRDGHGDSLPGQCRDLQISADQLEAPRIPISPKWPPREIGAGQCRFKPDPRRKSSACSAQAERSA